MKIKTAQNKKGFVLITTFWILVILSMVVVFLMGVVMGEWHIAISQREGVKAFYLAEAGIDYAVFKIRNDETLLNNFLNGNLNTTISQNSVFSPQGRFVVSLQSLTPGEASVRSEGYYSFGLVSAKRVIKAKLVRGIVRENWNNGFYGLGYVNIQSSRVNIVGDLYAGNDISISQYAQVNVQGDVKSNQNVYIKSNAILNKTGNIFAKNYPPAPTLIPLPQVDFDALLNQANIVYSENEFRNLLKNQSNVNLSGIIYVKGNIQIKKNQSLTVSGLLVADGSVMVGMSEGNDGGGKLKIVDPANGQLAGLLAKGKIQTGHYANLFEINGLLLSYDEIRLLHSSIPLKVNGGIITRSFSAVDLSEGLTVIFNQERIARIINFENLNSPTVKVDHWEEEY